jgi:3-deoxy-D-manno-octulosonic acid kinase
MICYSISQQVFKLRPMVAKTTSAATAESNLNPQLAPSADLALTIEPCRGGFALVNRRCVNEPLGALFDPNSYVQATALRDGRGQAFRVHGSFGVGALRHYRRGGMTGTLWQDRYWFTGVERTRSFRELRLLATLQARGLPVPMPLACRFLRSGLIYRADILTAWLPGANPLSAHVQTAVLRDFSAVGAMLRAFHAQGLWHADLNAHNILLTDAGPALIDFDRCRIRALQSEWQAQNLARLLRSLTKLGFAARSDFASSLWPALLHAYQSQTAQP